MAKHQSTQTTSNKNLLKKTTFKSLYRSDLVAILILYLLTIFLFRGIIFDNAVFSTGGDTVAAQSWSHAGNMLEEKEHTAVLWMPYVFSGMPAFGSLGYVSINIDFLGTFLRFILGLLFFGGTMSWMVQAYFFGGVCTYLFLRSLKLSEAASAIGALIFMFNPIAIGFAEAGHGSKLLALSYLPAVMLAVKKLFDRRSLLMFGLFAAVVGTIFLTNHVQMVYYVFMVAGCYWLWHVLTNVKSDFKLVAKQSGLFWAGIAVGFCIAAFVYLTVYQYSQYSIRGGGEAGVGGGGLAYDYATNWSFHPLEILTFFIPSFFGFQTPYYWGWMPWTETTNYFGVLPIILSIIALVYKRNKTTIFFLLISILVLFMSFGRFFAPFYDLLFNYLPFFNKFRAPVMILVLLPFFTGVLSAYGLTFLLSLHDKDSKVDSKKLQKYLLITMGILIAIVAIVALAGNGLFDSLGMFIKEGDVREYDAQQLSQLKEMRLDLLGKDTIKFLIVSAAILGSIIMYIRKAILGKVLIGILGLVFIINIFIIDSRYIDPKPNTESSAVFQPSQTIQFLQRDTTQFRVLPLDQRMLDNNSWMYHQIQNVGGYSPAKLKIYKEFLDSCFYKKALSMSILNMLDIKYLVVPGRLPEEGMFKLVNVDEGQRWLTYENTKVLSRAFFVDSVILLKDKNRIFDMLTDDRFNSGKEAIVEELPQDVPQKSDSTSVNVIYHHSQEFSYKVYTRQRALLVFSEVYYPAGWKATIDGNEVPIFKTDYILRSVVVPPGEHIVTMKFDPQVVAATYKISLAAWGFVLLCIVVGGVDFFRRKNHKN